MKALVNTRTWRVEVTREFGEPILRGGSWGTRESAFWKRLQDVLNARQTQPACRWIKTVPAKDGHLSGAPYYLTNKARTRCIADPHYAIRNAAEDFNDGVTVVLDYITEEARHG